MPPAAYRSKVGLQQYLSTVPVLRGLEAEQYAELASAAGVDVFHDGEYICTYTGTVDAVVRDLHTGKIGLFEHKTGATLEPFGAPMIMDEQAGAYWTFGAMFLAANGVIGSPSDLDFVL